MYGRNVSKQPLKQLSEYGTAGQPRNTCLQPEEDSLSNLKNTSQMENSSSSKGGKKLNLL